jgi:bacterioferritin
MKQHRIVDTQALRARARQDIEDGAVTADYTADREQVIALLNSALATEIVCVLRYRRHYFMATGLAAESVAEEFLAHSNEELAHADRLAARIVQLGGEPDFSPRDLEGRSHAEYVAGRELVEMIREDLIAERIAIEAYRAVIQYIGNDDTTTRKLLEEILAVEEEHADDLVSLIQGLGRERTRLSPTGERDGNGGLLEGRRLS